MENVADPVMRKIWYLDKLLNELTKGNTFEKIMRQDRVKQ
ncbi:MAG: DUF2200 family protein [Ignavibacterium sp.]|jgi:hypothetical protein